VEEKLHAIKRLLLTEPLVADPRREVLWDTLEVLVLVVSVQARAVVFVVPIAATTEI
jgi:hypothetical protein